jgi:hypothetical protein
MVDAPGEKYIFKLSVWSQDLISFIKVIILIEDSLKRVATKMLTNVSVIKNRF